MSTHRTARRALLGVAAVVLSTLAACGGTGTVGSSGESSATAAATGAAAESLQTAYDGAVGSPPTETVPVEEGVTAWVMSCGQELPTCSTAADAVKEAGDAIGWNTSICDGKLNPDGWSSCIRQGVAQGVDVVFVIGQDCASFEGPLREARDAGVTTIGVGSNDCDAQGGEKLFSAITQRFEDMSNEEWWNSMGTLQADYLIGKTDGKANVLEVTFADSLFGPWIQDGFEAELATCEECTIGSTLQLTNADVGAGAIGQKFSSALLAAPDVNAVTVPLDPWFLSGISQSIQSSGRSDELTVVGGFGQQANMDLIRSGQGEDATAAYDQNWEGWSAVDTALRVMAGQEVLPAGIGIQVVDADNNLPDADSPFSYTPEVDFRELYQQVWVRG